MSAPSAGNENSSSQLGSKVRHCQFVLIGSVLTAQACIISIILQVSKDKYELLSEFVDCRPLNQFCRQQEGTWLCALPYSSLLPSQGNLDHTLRYQGSQMFTKLHVYLDYANARVGIESFQALSAPLSCQIHCPKYLKAIFQLVVNFNFST
jgi:hypothetical protein